MQEFEEALEGHALNQWFSTQIAPRPVYSKKKFPRLTIDNFSRYGVATRRLRNAALN